MREGRKERPHCGAMSVGGFVTLWFSDDNLRSAMAGRGSVETALHFWELARVGREASREAYNGC